MAAPRSRWFLLAFVLLFMLLSARTFLSPWLKEWREAGEPPPAVEAQ